MRYLMSSKLKSYKCKIYIYRGKEKLSSNIALDKNIGLLLAWLFGLKFLLLPINCGTAATS